VTLMLTLKDCIAMCDLTDQEVAAIAEHEHLPMIVAAELGNYLIHGPGGVPGIKRMICDDIAAAERRGDRRHALALKLVLHHFVQHHPDHAPAAATRRPKRERVLHEFFERLPRREAAVAAPASTPLRKGRRC
jgi:hypothetical protein